MASRRIAIWTLLALGWLAAALPAAEEPSVSSAEVRALIQRLERAESKINDLEHELAETRDAKPREFPGQATTLFDAPPAADGLSGQVEELLKQHEELQTSHKELTEKHDGLSKDYEKLNESHEKLSEGYDKFAADIAKGKGVVIPAGSAATIRVSGRIHLDYWAFPQTNDGAAVLEGSPAAPVDPEDRFGLRRIAARLARRHHRQCAVPL